MKFHPLSELFPLMQGREFDELVADVKDNGLREAIWTYQGQILDGRNRWKACEAANITSRPMREYSGDDALGFVLSLNLHRRHLTDAQKAVLALDILPHMEDRAKERQLATLKQNAVPERIPERDGDARDQAAKMVGTNPRYVSDAKRIAKEAPELVEKMRSGQLTVPAAMRQLKDNHNKSELQKPVSVQIAGLHVGDFREKAKILADECAELVFTDPPYDRESIPLFEAAAKEAARILKPGGSFVAYCGHIQLPQVLDLCSKHLRYWWTIGCFHSGPLNVIDKYGIRNGWKPLVWFVKGTRGDVQTFVHDVVTGTKEKSHHKWQQAESEAAYYIERLSSPSGLIIDFFAGGGTTLVAAERLGRPWIAFEINPVSAEQVVKRLKDVRVEAA